MLPEQNVNSNEGALDTLSRYTVLVAEDSPLELEMLELYLSNWGLSVKGAKDGAEAYDQLVADENIRLLITDMNMPVMDGLELLQRVHTSGRTKLYSIVLSGISDRRTLVAALKAGASDYMVKPCHPEQIFARLAVLDKVMSLEESYQGQLRDLFDVMGQMLGSRDYYTLEHSLRVAELSKRMGRGLGLGIDELNLLEIGCIIHDIGKIAIPDDVLLKPGRFAESDRLIMNLHPTLGATFIATRYPDDRVSYIVLQHHERLDGSGYPFGLKGNEINELANIVSVADIFEALVASRPYKNAMDFDRALNILKEEAETGKIDGTVIASLERVIERFNPLSIKCPFHHKDIVTLEAFRQVAFFREPMCSFYNYRFLNVLSQKKDIFLPRERYHLTLLEICNRNELKKQIGFFQFDTILDAIGEGLNEELLRHQDNYEKIYGHLLLLRRGSEYFIFSNYPDETVESTLLFVKDVIKRYEDKLGLKISIKTSSFPSDCSFDKALGAVLETRVHTTGKF